MTRTSPSRQTVVITGASAGIGRAIAVEFARAGWNVAAIARGEAGLAGTIRAIEGAGGRAMAFAADVADPDAMVEAADAVAAEWGGIDVWVNNAMVTVYAPVQETTPDEFARVTAVTYLGQVHGTLAALKHMRRRDAGTIVQIGSALTYRSIPLQAPYCAAKAAVRGFTDSLRSELLHDRSRIRLTMVQLPAVNTPQFGWARSVLPREPEPVPPIYQPETIARHVFHAAMTAPREMWVGASAWKAIVGNMLVPGWIDGFLARNDYQGEMTSRAANRQRADNLHEPVDTDPGSRGRFDDRASGGVMAADPRWLKLGLAAILGTVAGTMLFATRAEGKAEGKAAERRRLRHRL